MESYFNYFICDGIEVVLIEIKGFDFVSGIVCMKKVEVVVYVEV